jgi:DegV family protein with EDD domain
MVHIITDTTSALSPEMAERYKIPVIPQIIHFGEESFHEGIDIDNQEFMRRLQEGDVHPKTAAPEPELFIEQFERLTADGEPILCIHPSTEVSGTVRSATIAAQEFPGADIRVIDTRLIASPLGTVVKLAAQWAEEGRGADAIETRIQEMAPRCHIYFLVATLEYLARGGRIGGASALVGSVLQIKPILSWVNGKVEPFEKERTMRRALTRLKEIVYAQYPTEEEGYLSILHAGVPDQAQALADDLCEMIDIEEATIHDMPPAIVTHAGPGVLGAAFFA